MDNQSTKSLTKNPVFHEQIKHINIQYYYIKESIIKERTNLLFILTDLQSINGLTKAISNKKWLQFLNKISLYPLTL
jgi:hypothetical protein